MNKDLNWYEPTECYLCQGTGKLIVQGKDTSIPEDEDCPCCEGTGMLKIMRR